MWSNSKRKRYDDIIDEWAKTVVYIQLKVIEYFSKVNFSTYWCRILKSSFNNRQRGIESLRSFSTLFLNCSTTTPLNACTRSTRRGIGGASTKNL